MERGLIMLLHSVIIGVLSYPVMIYMGQKQSVAENRSILLGAIIVIYMILFGHGLPTTMNKEIYS